MTSKTHCDLAFPFDTVSMIMALAFALVTPLLRYPRSYGLISFRYLFKNCHMIRVYLISLSKTIECEGG